jgi:UDP-glucose 4-epimerase
VQAAKLILEGETAILPRACKRDWTDSRQVARAVMGILTAESLSHPLYNISCGTQWTMAEWVAALAEARPSLARLAYGCLR